MSETVYTPSSTTNIGQDVVDKSTLSNWLALYGKLIVLAAGETGVGTTAIVYTVPVNKTFFLISLQVSSYAGATLTTEQTVFINDAASLNFLFYKRIVSIPDKIVSSNVIIYPVILKFNSKTIISNKSVGGAGGSSSACITGYEVDTYLIPILK